MSVRRMAMLTGLLLLLMTACGGEAPDRARTGSQEPGEIVDTTHAPGEVRWEREWEDAFSRAEAEQKAVLVDFYADWCVWCKKLDTTTYRHAEVVSLLHSELVPLKVDVDDGGKVRARKWGVSGLPTILVIATDGRELGRIPGYLPPREFVSRVQRILS